jgi:hypothetical protein
MHWDLQGAHMMVVKTRKVKIIMRINKRQLWEAVTVMSMCPFKTEMTLYTQTKVKNPQLPHKTVSIHITIVC